MPRKFRPTLGTDKSTRVEEARHGRLSRARTSLAPTTKAAERWWRPLVAFGARVERGQLLHERHRARRRWTDTLETAIECGLSLRPSRADEPSLKRDRHNPVQAPFDRMIDDWFSVTYLMNNLNRGLGFADAYPFVLASPTIEKLRFVYETIVAAVTG
jgi:hypothetical protein